MAQSPNSDELIKHLLKNLYPNSFETGTYKKAITQKKQPVKQCMRDGNFWIFTKKEIEKMPQKYRKSFIVAEQRIFYRIKMSGVYEARYKRKAEGIKIEVSALTLEALKEKFIQALPALNVIRKDVYLFPPNFVSLLTLAVKLVL